MPHAKSTDVPERYVPGEMRGDLVEVEHLTRYRWVAPLARDAVVLDAGCGMAYGTRMLHEAGAARAVGVDISQDAVDLARGAAEDVELIVGDIVDLPFDDASVDVVVAFEVIEHVPDRDAVLDELARVLTPKGVLAISSPNRREYPPGNPHHLHEYTPEELEEALRERFEHVRLLRQENWVASTVLTEDELASDDLATHPMLVGKVDGIAPGRETYTVALCSTSVLPEIGSTALLSSPVEVRRWLDHFDAQQERMRELEQTAARAEDRVDELRDVHRRLREAELDLQKLAEAEHDAATARRDRDDARRDRARAEDRVRELEALVERADRVREDITSSLSWRLTAPLRALRRR